MRKSIVALFALALAVGGLWYMWEFHFHNVPSVVKQYVDNGEIATFKARYTPDQISEDNRKELIVDNVHAYKEPETKYLPLVLMNVKYVQSDKRSREGMLLWSLVDGEMILNTDLWEKTHGYADALESGASRNDFKVINALAKNKGSLSVDQLEKELHVEKDTLYPWVEGALNKHLIVKKGNEIQLHFQDPKLTVLPETKMSDNLVKKGYSYSQRISKKYSVGQIESLAKVAFGDDFTIRNATEVFLPVYFINVINPDGSISTTVWNAVTGKKMKNF